MTSIKKQGYRILLFWLLAVFLLASLTVNLLLFSKLKSDYWVTYIIDGDTFVLKNGGRIRILGVDTPEKGECGYEQAKARLSDLIMDKSVKLAEERLDWYGRKLALVYFKGRLINEILLKEGWGAYDYSKSSRSSQMLALFRQVKQEKQGIYGTLCGKNSYSKKSSQEKD